MSRSTDIQQKIAEVLCGNIAQQLTMSHSAFNGGGERLTLNASVAMIGITATAVSLGEFEPNVSARLTHDHVLFSCLYTANASNYNRDGTLAVEFEISNVIKTLDQFQMMTGRSFEPLMDKSLLESVQEAREKAATSTQFTPH